MFQCGGGRCPGARGRRVGGFSGRVRFPSCTSWALGSLRKCGGQDGQCWARPLPGAKRWVQRRWVCPPPPPTAACPPHGPRLSCTRAALVSQEFACYFYCVNKASWFNTQLPGAGCVLSVGCGRSEGPPSAFGTLRSGLAWAEPGPFYPLRASGSGLQDGASGHLRAVERLRCRRLCATTLGVL